MPGTFKVNASDFNPETNVSSAFARNRLPILLVTYFGGMREENNEMNNDNGTSQKDAARPAGSGDADVCVQLIRTSDRSDSSQSRSSKP